MRQTALVVYFLLLLGACSSNVNARNAVHVQSCLSILPASTEKQIEMKYQGWRVLEYNDLSEDDKAIWVKYHGAVCPGVALVNSANTPKEDRTYGIVIVRGGEGIKRAKLLILKETNSVASLKTLYEENSVTNYPVIYKASPGVYRDFYDNSKTVTVSGDALIYEHLEASAIAFYHTGTQFHRLVISD